MAGYYTAGLVRESLRGLQKTNLLDSGSSSSSRAIEMDTNLLTISERAIKNGDLVVEILERISVVLPVIINLPVLCLSPNLREMC